MSSLASRVDSFPESWRAQEGDKLVGKIIDLAENDTGYGPYEIVTVLVDGESTEDGQPIGIGDERSWHAFDTVVKNELAKQPHAIGDSIAAKFHGVRPGKDGNEYKAWRVIVERAEPHAEPAKDEAGGGESDIPFRPSAL